MHDLVVVGGGAAGLLAAGFAANSGLDVAVIEHGDKPANKILITGKGRCNVTNDCDEQTFLKNVRRSPKFMYSSIYAFNCQQTMKLFEQLGVPLKTERGRRVFPQSDRAADIRYALIKHAGQAHIIKAGVKSLVIEQGAVCGVTLKNGETVRAKNVLVATGGLSYPTTGSTGDGYKLAAQAGHSIITPQASLVPLICEDNNLAALTGVALKNVLLKLTIGNKQVFAEQGEMLFTHTGISGPLVLSASAHMDEPFEQAVAHIDMKPALDEQTLDKRIARDFEKYAGKNITNALKDLTLSALVPVFIERSGIAPEKKANQITKIERAKLTKLFKNFEIKVVKKDKIEHAVITSGGVNTAEVDPRTMQSKLVKNLFFAGEVLDVDAYTGGFNLQIAFSSAYAAAKAVCDAILGLNRFKGL